MQKLVFTNSRGQSITIGNTAPFILSKIDGTGSPQTTILTSKAPGQDGKSYHRTLLEERILSIEGTVFGTSSEDMFKKRQQLCSIFNPKLEGTLTYMNDAGNHEINCTVQDSPSFKDKSEPIQEFLVQLFCPNPFWLDSYISSKKLSYIMGGLSFPLKLPTIFATRGHKAIIINAGDAETPVEIEFYGPATNPVIKNNTINKYIKIKRDIGENDKLIINTEFGNKTVKIIRADGSIEDAKYYIDLNPDFEFWSLQVGENEIEYSSNNDSQKNKVIISYRNRYVGV